MLCLLACLPILQYADARTYEAISKKGGKTTLTARIVVAADGKTRITTQTGKDGQGQTVSNSIFYEKQ